MCYVTLRYFVTWLCCVMLRYVTLLCDFVALLCYVMLCYVMLRYFVPLLVSEWQSFSYFKSKGELQKLRSIGRKHTITANRQYNKKGKHKMNNLEKIKTIHLTTGLDDGNIPVCLRVRSPVQWSWRSTCRASWTKPTASTARASSKWSVTTSRKGWSGPESAAGEPPPPPSSPCSMRTWSSTLAGECVFTVPPRRSSHLQDWMLPHLQKCRREK